RAENPKPLIEDQPGFAPKTIETFRKITQAVQAKLGIKADMKEFGAPTSENPYIYGADLPRDVDGAAFARAYNQAQRSRGFKYKIEVSEGADGRKSFYTQSTALKLNTARIFKGVFA